MPGDLGVAAMTLSTLRALGHGSAEAPPDRGTVTGMDDRRTAATATRPMWLRGAPEGVTEESFSEGLAEALSRKGSLGDRTPVVTHDEMMRRHGLRR